jgi:hypothetical protein
VTIILRFGSFPRHVRAEATPMLMGRVDSFFWIPACAWITRFEKRKAHTPEAFFCVLCALCGKFFLFDFNRLTKLGHGHRKTFLFQKLGK